MKYLFLILMLIPNLLFSMESKIKCDFGMIEFYGNKIEIFDQNHTIFNLEYEIIDNSLWQISNFNLSNKFKSNFKNLSNNKVIINNDFEKIFPNLNNQFESVTNDEINDTLKKWILPQLQKFTDSGLNNQSIILSTVLENGVVVNNIIDKNKLSQNNYQNFIKIDVVLADGKFTFNGNCYSAEKKSVLDDTSNNSFLDFCKKSKISDLDKDVAMLCIENLD